MKKALLILFMLPLGLMATTLTVTNLNDFGFGSLRQAIINASSGDTIDFDVMLFSNGNDTLKLASEISFNKSLVINGFHTSYDTLFISGENTSRIFNITGGTVELNRMTFIYGNSVNGGAIYSSANLEMNDCNFMHNYTSGYGGALYKSSGNLLINDCQFFHNEALDYGGAIYLPPGSGNVIQHSTFYDNYTSTSGGALYGFVANVDFYNCTFTGNTAVSEGGAIYDWGSVVIINLVNCTVVGNSASQAGGIDHWGSSIEFTTTGSIITGNTGSPNLDIWGAGALLMSGGYNIIGDATYSGSTGTDQLNVSAGSVNLGTLGDNGEQTFTMMPDAASPAVDAGDPADLSDAQNGPVTDGIRDAGAAEFYTCPDIESSYFVIECSAYTVPSGDETYSAQGLTIAHDTIQTVCGADSLMTIYIFIDDASVPVPDVASLSDASFDCSATPTAPTATDACSGTIVGTTTTTFPITTIGTTTVTWTYDDGVGNISTQDQDIIVNTIPLDITVNQSGFSLTANETADSYVWLDCNDSYNLVPFATSQTFNFLADGNYACEITVGGCVDTTDCYIISGIGFEENEKMNLAVYPNPTSGIFTITGITSDGIITIYAADGKLVLTKKSISDENSQIDLSGFERGIYLVKFKNDESEKTIRVVLQ